jgi:hypothetical protein
LKLRVRQCSLNNAPAHPVTLVIRVHDNVLVT